MSQTGVPPFQLMSPDEIDSHFDTAIHLVGSLVVDAAAREHVLQGLDLIREIGRFIGSSTRRVEINKELPAGSAELDEMMETLDSALALSRMLIGMPDDSVQLLDFDAELMTILDRLTHQLRTLGRKLNDVDAEAGFNLAMEASRHVSAGRVLIPAFRESLLIRRSAQESADSAAKSAEIARDDAGEVGDVKLAMHFSEYATKQLTTSVRFRAAAFLSAAAAVATGAWLYFHAPTTDSVSDQVARGLIVVALASIGTYCGRLAGQYRHDGNWAATVAVQLKEFARFMEPVTDDAARAQIQVMFANRVLGATPTSGEAGQSPMSTDQALAAFLNRK